jgi:hypothetical protein
MAALHHRAKEKGAGQSRSADEDLCPIPIHDNCSPRQPPGYPVDELAHAIALTGNYATIPPRFAVKLE